VKGAGFWQRWKQAWQFELVLEASQFSIGYIGAQMLGYSPWSLLALVVPIVIAYYALSRSVKEVLEKTALAEELDNNLKELKETQAQLIQSAKLATVGTLAAGIAHEINNPLAVISGRAEILKARIERGGENVDMTKVLSGIGDIHSMTGRISAIVNGLLSYSRRSDVAAPMRLDALMDDSLPLLERKLEKNSIEIVREYKSSPKVFVVPTQLQQVFMNLVSNAVDAMPETGGTITLGCEVADGFATAYVRDNGSGIPDDVRERMFEPFFTTKDVGKGTGLGLFICHKIVSDHGGEMTVESAIGKGTTFFIRLPLSVHEHMDNDSGNETTPESAEKEHSVAVAA